MNEPANFETNMQRPFNFPKDKPDWSLKCPDDNVYDNPPYLPLAGRINAFLPKLSDKTLCMNAKQAHGQFNHYDVHSLYGFSETEPTLL
jgi:hypothetical protein